MHSIAVVVGWKSRASTASKPLTCGDVEPSVRSSARLRRLAASENTASADRGVS